jgi:hypothetical protein
VTRDNANRFRSFGCEPARHAAATYTASLCSGRVAVSCAKPSSCRATRNSQRSTNPISTVAPPCSTDTGQETPIVATVIVGVRVTTAAMAKGQAHPMMGAGSQCCVHRPTVIRRQIRGITDIFPKTETRSRFYGDR